jgi:hypothetical protein
VPISFLPLRAFDADWVISRMRALPAGPDRQVIDQTGSAANNGRRETTMARTTGTTRRIGNLAIRLAAVVALALLLAGAVAPHAGAEANNGPAYGQGRL